MRIKKNKKIVKQANTLRHTSHVTTVHTHFTRTGRTLHARMEAKGKQASSWHSSMIFDVQLKG